MPHRINIQQLNSRINSGKKLLVKFSAEWCGQCRMSSLLIEKVKSDYDDIEFIELDIDDNDMWDDESLKIKKVPTFIGYDKKHLIINEEGYHNEEEIRNLIETLQNNNIDL